MGRAERETEWQEEKCRINERQDTNINERRRRGSERRRTGRNRRGRLLENGDRSEDTER